MIAEGGTAVKIDQGGGHSEITTPQSKLQRKMDLKALKNNPGSDTPIKILQMKQVVEK